METKQLLGLQIFEFTYLMALSFLPFLMAQREVSLIILTVGVVYIVYTSVARYILGRHIDPANKVVVITGCDSGFGNVLAQRLDILGFTVVAGCLDKNSQGAKLLNSSETSHLHVIQLDVTDDESVKNCVCYLKDRCSCSALWALVNNAGVLALGDVEFTSLDSYKRVVDVNLFGTVRMTKACLPLIRAAKGRVINISGTVGRLSLPFMSAYSISNHGIEAFSDALRLEMRDFGIKVVVIEPGNFYGSTGFQNKAALARFHEEFRKMWENAPDSVKQAYGKSYAENQYKTASKSTRSAASSLAPVIDVLENAVLQTRVRPRYLIDGSNQPIDLANMLLRWRPWLPELLMDFFIACSYQQKTKIH